MHIDEVKNQFRGTTFNKLALPLSPITPRAPVTGGEEEVN